MQSIIIIHYPLFDTKMIICEGVQKRSGGPLYDTVVICKGRSKNGQGGPLYDTAMIILCKGV